MPKKEKKENRYSLTRKDFQKRLRDFGLPYHRDTILKWEKKGWLEFRRTPYGWRIFDNEQEIDNLIKKLLRNKGLKFRYLYR